MGMRIFIGGIACVGKTAIGASLADFLKRRFYDLDAETERFFGTSIERLQNTHLAPNAFRRDVAKALQHLLSREESRNCVIALPPSGLMGPCWKVVNKVQDAAIIVLDDTPENILGRIVFYDIDSQKINKILTDDERRYYLREIRSDLRYFRRSWQKSHLVVNIAECVNVEDAAGEVCRQISSKIGCISGDSMALI
jgi:shikimate kinase